METIEELSKELNLNEEQSVILKDFIGNLVIELLESIKQDHIKNIDETINSLKGVK